MKRTFRQKKNSILHPAVLALMLISILLNICLSTLIRTTELPFFIDTVGTITATALGGIVPGIITAFMTNVINFLMDGESIFYACLNMLIAIVSAVFFSDNSLYSKHTRSGNKDLRVLDVIVYILILSFIGGGIGGEITWYLNGVPSDVPLSVAIQKWASDNFSLNIWGCHVVQTYITDTMDKGISVCIALIIISFLPKKVKEYVRLSSWRQKPLSYEEQHLVRKNHKGNISIALRINLIIILSTLLITVVAFVFSLISFREKTIESLSESAEQIAYLASKEIDPEMVDEYIKKGFAAQGYARTRGRLSIIKNSSHDITFLYVYKIQKNSCRVVFDLDATLSNGDYVNGEAPGTIVPVEAALLPYMNDLIAGNKIPPVQMEDEYGSFLASYYPVYDSKGNCVCYAVSNVESQRISFLLGKYFGKVLLLFSGFLMIIVAISILTTRYHIVMPIMSMTLYANELAESKGGTDEGSLEKIEDLDIHTGDEVEQLYKAFCKLTGETVFQLNENRSKAEAISKMQNVLIITMADMVESRDSDTGAHVLKTAAYVRIILQGLRRSGYYTEKISDKYMRDVEMSAPLHDVGKINIPDAILNKPGKLTDEEFAIMKTHTTAGRKILENAISSMEGDNYLKEARNLAAYHHERWDGKGYPEGLHGEVIPLSARIMAVADVFDALSSPRVYKPAFPLDEAVKMIQEGSGTQFDPKCVEVFVESIAEVKKIHKQYQET